MAKRGRPKKDIKADTSQQVPATPNSFNLTPDELELATPIQDELELATPIQDELELATPIQEFTPDELLKIMDSLFSLKAKEQDEHIDMLMRVVEYSDSWLDNLNSQIVDLQIQMLEYKEIKESLLNEQEEVKKGLVDLEVEVNETHGKLLVALDLQERAQLFQLELQSKVLDSFNKNESFDDLG